MFDLTVPDIVPYLLAILGLLLVWQVYKIQVQAGRIETVSSWDRSGIRLFVHVTPADSHACKVCKAAHGMAFLPTIVAAKKFRAMDQNCTNPAGCRCLLIGLMGAWPEAERVLAYLQVSQGRAHLSAQQLAQLIDGAQARRTGIVADQISVSVLDAMRSEESAPDQAIAHYRFVVENAQKERDLPFVIPAYLRLADLLEQHGRHEEALAVVEQFLKASGPSGLQEGQAKPAPAPTEAERTLMSLRKTRLLASLKKAETAKLPS
ncbi:MAG: hypothetical protein AB1411_05055 [Nitrospirota bacterium]